MPNERSTKKQVLRDFIEWAQRGGREKWTKLSDLTVAERTLTELEPGQIIRIGANSYKIECVCLNPASAIIVPVVKAEKREQ